MQAIPRSENMAVYSVLHLLKQISAKSGIPVVLIGAYALQAYGVIWEKLKGALWNTP